VLEIVREIDCGHSAAPELALKRVAVGQGRPEPFQDVGRTDLLEIGMAWTPVGVLIAGVYLVVWSLFRGLLS
jgi:hypothetical protein